MTVAAEPSLTRLSRAAGIELHSYRPAHVREQVERALHRERAADVDSLARLMRADAGARTRFRRGVAVSVSGIFRDPQQFELLERELLPPLVEASRRVRVWSAGCADGSELYTIALVLERLGALERSFLLGTDLLEENLRGARAAGYLDDATRRRLRPHVRWQRHDLTSGDAPPGRWQLVLCRNVAIYLEPEAKRRLHESLAGALALGGLLLVGRSERLANAAALGLERAGAHAYRRAA